MDTGCRTIGETGPRTRIADVSARMSCLYCSLIVYDKRIILRMSYPDDSGRRCGLAQMAFKLWPESLLIREPKPPPLRRSDGHISLNWTLANLVESHRPEPFLDFQHRL